LKDQYDQKLLIKNKEMEDLRSAKQGELQKAVSVEEAHTKLMIKQLEDDFRQQLSTKEKEKNVVKQKHKVTLEKQELQYKEQLDKSKSSYSQLSIKYTNVVSQNENLFKEKELLLEQKSSDLLTKENDSFRQEVVSLKLKNSTPNENKTISHDLQALRNKELNFETQQSLQANTIALLETKASTVESYYNM
jgi:hypothetical protein